MRLVKSPTVPRATRKRGLPSRFLLGLAVVWIGLGPGCSGGPGDTSLDAIRSIGGDRVRLVLVVVVDQLRADRFEAAADRFGPGGFRAILEKGVHFRNARFRHSTTLTAVGHAALATGGNTAQHGIAGNDWFDSLSGRRVYSVEDDRHVLLGQETKPHEGTSPRNLTGTTVGDELIRASDSGSRVFSVSLKDRGAILPGGRLGKAFWFSSKTGGFLSSTYYYTELPSWVAAWNGTKPARRWWGGAWTLLRGPSVYKFRESDGRPGEKDVKGMGTVFPHALRQDTEPDFLGALPSTPFADELVAQFAEELLVREGLGKGERPDMLCLSFSATDNIGHAFGPFSLEYEDNLLHLDATLARLLKAVDGAVGLKRTLVVVASDHGVDDIPEVWRDLGYPAGRHDPEQVKARVNEGLRRKFGIGEDLVAAFWSPSIYLDLGKLARFKLDVAEVESAAAEELLGIEGIAAAVTRTDLLRGAVPDTPIMKRLQASFHAERSGHVLIVQDQFWYLYSEAEKYAAMHGSPYEYDIHVPVLFAGPGIGSRTIEDPICPESIAATISSVLGIAAPSGSTAEPLTRFLR